MIKRLQFPSKDSLIHFIAENHLTQFAVVLYGTNYELAYIEEVEEQPAHA